MPVKKRGFFFQYFDKMICGVVALGILAAALYAVMKGGSVNRVAPPSEVINNMQIIETKMRQGGESTPPERVDYLGRVESRIENYSPPRTLACDIFYPELPKALPAVAIGLDQEAVLDFKAPLDKGSVKVEGPEGIVDVVRHPEDEDYARVVIRSHDKEGDVTVVGVAGGLKHEYPVTVDAKVGKTAYPPTGIEAEAGLGTVTVRIVPDPRNADVEVESYEVWRRDWADPLGEYQKVPGMGAAAATARAGRAAGAGMAALGAAFNPMAGLRAGAQAGPGGAIEWEDAGVKPGQKYSYKVRTVGANTYPRESDFTPSAFAEVPRMIDFRVTGSSPDRLGIEVADMSAGGVSQEKFWVSMGDEIGGVVQDQRTARVTNLLTDYVLVDFQRNVIQPDRGLISDRAIYSDAEGNLHEAWRWRKGTESKFWDLVEQGGRRAQPGAFMGPMGPTGVPAGAPPGVRGPTGGPRGQ